jgi:carbon-monoxide dehydrogenase large subunit
MMALGHGRAQVQDITIGGTRDGRVTHCRLDVVADAGASADIGSVLPAVMTRPMASGVYDIANIECRSRSVVTNTCPIVAFRGAGRPEATAAIERAIDMFAAELGRDPAEIRRINLIAPFSEPYETAIGQSYDVGDYVGALDRVLAAAGYDELRAEQSRRRDAGTGPLLGIGVSIYVEITNAIPGPESASIEVAADGSAVVYTGTSPHGQGHETAWAMIAAERTGIPLSAVRVVWGDTDAVRTGGGTFGSRSLQAGGAAVDAATAELVEVARKLAADHLEADVADVVLDIDRGCFHVAGTPAMAMTWGDVAAAASEGGDKLAATQALEYSGSSFPFGAHVAVVEVDAETGQVRLVRHIACDDAGRILNPLLLEGQLHGGIATGAAQALMEEVRYDEDGNPVTSNFADYAMISAAELPSFELVPMETPTPLNTLGAKGVGESGTIGSTPAVQSAVVDALAHLGVRHVDMPATPERIWRAIGDASE